MRVTGIKFNEEGISKFLMAYAEMFSEHNYEYIKEVKYTLKLGPKESLDIIILLDKHKDKIQHLWDGLNFRLGYNEKIPTFFRGKDQKSFLFPGGVNIIYATIDEFLKLRYRWNVIAGVADKGLHQEVMKEINEKFREPAVLVIDDDSYFSEDKDIVNLWASRPGKKDIRNYL